MRITKKKKENQVLGLMFLPNSFLQSSKNGKRAEEQLWVIAWPSCGAFEALAFIFFMSPMFPSKKEGGGPLIPCFRSFDRSLTGFNIRASHIFIILLTKPINAIVIMILRRSNGKSMARFYSLFMLVSKVVACLALFSLYIEK